MSRTVDTRPTKSFFVDMLTRDISVFAAILDLCDNALGRTLSLASAEPSEYITNPKAGIKPLKRFFVHLDVAANALKVRDNCGGMSIDQAQHDVFRLGRHLDTPLDTGLSVYGIGMKRAFFKLADRVSVQSSRAGEWFDLKFRVSTWKRQGDDAWDIPFTRIGKGRGPQGVPDGGTLIELTDLTGGARAVVGTRTFMNDLRQRLQATYSLFTAYGLDLRLNGEAIRSTIPMVASEQLKPARRTLTIGSVRVVIIAGLTPKGTPASPSSSGWFVYCNGRLVVEADKTRTTGWDDILPQWHSKFMRFAGFVFFDSADSRALPWTTTKQALVDDAEVFLRARQEMHVQARPVLDFLNRLYPADVAPDGVHERALFEQAKGTRLSGLGKQDRSFSPSRPSSKTAEVVNIQYKKAVEQVNRARTKLGRRLSASQVGSRTFDHFIKTECDD